MESQLMTLWDVIDQLGDRMPLTESKVEGVLGEGLRVKSQDQFLTHLTGGELALDGGLKVARSSLALGPNGEFLENSGLTLYLNGACITRDQLTARYGELEMVGTPRGHSLQESTSYAWKHGSWQAVFSFREANRDCLSHVSIGSSDKQ